MITAWESRQQGRAALWTRWLRKEWVGRVLGDGRWYARIGLEQTSGRESTPEAARDAVDTWLRQQGANLETP